MRRKSKEINKSCETMWENAQDRKGAADLWRLLGGNNKSASELTDEALRQTFDEIDVRQLASPLTAMALDQNASCRCLCHQLTQRSSSD